MAEPDLSGAGAMGGGGPVPPSSTPNVAKIGAKVSVDGVRLLVSEFEALRKKVAQVREEMNAVGQGAEHLGLAKGGSTGSSKLSSMVSQFKGLSMGVARQQQVFGSGVGSNMPVPVGTNLAGQIRQMAAIGPTSQYPAPPPGPSTFQRANETLGFGSIGMAVLGANISRFQEQMAASIPISQQDMRISAMYGVSYGSAERDRLRAMGQFAGSRENALATQRIGMSYGMGYQQSLQFSGQMALMSQASGGSMTAAEAAQSGAGFLNPRVQKIQRAFGMPMTRQGGQVRNFNSVAQQYITDMEGLVGSDLTEATFNNLRSLSSPTRFQMQRRYGLDDQSIDMIADVGLLNLNFRNQFNRDINFESAEDLRRAGFTAERLGLASIDLETTRSNRDAQYRADQEGNMVGRLQMEKKIQEALGDTESALRGLIGIVGEFERVLKGLLAVGIATQISGGFGGGRGGMGGPGGGGPGGLRGIAGSLSGRGAGLPGMGSRGALGGSTGMMGAARMAGGIGLMIGGGMMAHNADSGSDVGLSSLMAGGGAALLGAGPAGIAAAAVLAGGYAAINYFKAGDARNVGEGYANALTMGEQALVRSFQSYTDGLAGGGGSANAEERGRYDAWQVRRGALIAAMLDAASQAGVFDSMSGSEAAKVAEVIKYYSDGSQTRDDWMWRAAGGGVTKYIDQVRNDPVGQEVYAKYFGSLSSPFELSPVLTEEAASLVQRSSDIIGAASGNRSGDGSFDPGRPDGNPWTHPGGAADSASMAGLDGRMADRLRRLFSASGGRVWLGQGKRSPEAQRQMFLERHVEDPNGPISWDGKRWRRVRGAPAAPPGRSMHEIGLAADLVGPGVDDGWLEQNASRFGLKTFTDVNNEPWHVQLAELPNSRAEYEGGGGSAGHVGAQPEQGSDGHGQSNVFSGSGVVGVMSGVGYSIVAALAAGTGAGMVSGGGSSTTAGPAGADVPAYAGGGTPLAPEQVARMAYAVGFRGQDLIDVVAIAGRESGYNPMAHNPNANTGDNSYGLMQINMIGNLGPDRLQRFGISRNEDLFDPMTNLRAAYILYQMSNNTLNPWGGYKGMSNTYSTDVEAARQAVLNAGLNSGDGSFDMGGGRSSGGIAITFGNVIVSVADASPAQMEAAANEFISRVTPKIEALGGVLAKRSS